VGKGENGIFKTAIFVATLQQKKRRDLGKKLLWHKLQKVNRHATICNKK
jgi:hypothetical protein